MPMRRTEQIRQWLPAFLKEAGVEHREDSADNRARRELRRLVAWVGGDAALVDDARELRERLCATLGHTSACGERLDEEQTGDAWVVLHDCEQFCERGADPLAPARLALVCLLCTRADFRECFLEQGEIAVLAVGEHFVEGLARYPCAAGHLLDGGLRVTDVGHRVECCGE